MTIKFVGQLLVSVVSILISGPLSFSFNFSQCSTTGFTKVVVYTILPGLSVNDETILAALIDIFMGKWYKIICVVISSRVV